MLTESDLEDAIAAAQPAPAPVPEIIAAETPTPAPDAPASAAHQFNLFIERIADAARRPLLISQEDAPEFLGIKRTAFFRLKAEGAFRPVSLPGATMYKRRELEAWVEKLKHARG